MSDMVALFTYKPVATDTSNETLLERLTSEIRANEKLRSDLAAALRSYQNCHDTLQEYIVREAELRNENRELRSKVNDGADAFKKQLRDLLGVPEETYGCSCCRGCDD